MSLRTRLLLAFAGTVLVPIALLAFGVRQEMYKRLSAEYQVRVDAVVSTLREDLVRESSSISDRLASLETALQNDNQFRRVAVAGDESQREYLLDYAGTAMRLTGLTMLQIEDGEGRILSSGHFRNEHGRIDLGLADAIRNARDLGFVIARGPEHPFLALARARSFVIGGRPFTLVGGVTVDDAFLAQLARDRAIVVSLRYPGTELSTAPHQAVSDSAVGELAIPVIRNTSGTTFEVVQGQLEVTQSLTPLKTLLRSADAWFLLTAAGAVVAALLLAVWVSSRVSRPLAALADKTAVLDLDRLDVDFDAGTDEVGRLSRLLGDLAGRLRTSSVRIREAERRATIGDFSRQVNHDIKNGLIPLRNVMRHLSQVEQNDPAHLSSVFAERRQTIDSSLAYLETLAASYQRLSPPIERREIDVNALVAAAVRAAQSHEGVTFETDLGGPTLGLSLARVVGDPVAFRRILENLIANAVDSLESHLGRVTVSTRLIEDGERHTVRVTVADTGRGMSAEEVKRVFDDFYTTKPGGTGLGLSIVRRLVMDLHGTIHVESTPTQGTQFIIDIPAQAEKYSA
jgi:signal transduction histidine kinase